MQPSQPTPATLLTQPATGSEPAQLAAYYRQRAQRAIDHFGNRPQDYSQRAPLILIEPENLIAMLGDGLQPTDREKLLIANRENQQARAELDRLLYKLRRVLFTTSPSQEASWQLHAHLTTILKPYEKAAPAPTHPA